MTFKTHFDAFVCEGDHIECTVDGMTITATLEHDWDITPDDADCYSKAQKEAWRNDEWHFFGLVLSVSVDGVPVCDHAASLWGLEGNFPGRAKNTNKYLTDTANELLSEALAEGRKALVDMQAKLARVAPVAVPAGRSEIEGRA